MIHKQLVVGPFQCNCSILICEKTKEAIIIDAGDEAPRIIEELKNQGCTVKFSFHTHAHLDHIGAVKELKAFSPSTKIALHASDLQLYENLPMQGKLFGVDYDVPPKVDQLIEDEETLSFGDGKELKIIHTPGHSPGGVCLKFKEGLLGDKPVLFTGDTLFHESIGRTDLWGGDFSVLKKSIKERIYSQEKETVVCPGHGLRTSIEHEMAENPFVNI